MSRETKLSQREKLMLTIESMKVDEVIKVNLIMLDYDGAWFLNELMKKGILKNVCNNEDDMYLIKIKEWFRF